MFKDLTISYLTGTAQVIDNPLGTTTVIWRDRTVGQMFFQPYESIDEFLFCAKFTFSGLLLLSITIYEPILGVLVPVAMLGAAVVCLALAGISNIFDDSASAFFSTFFLEAAEYLVADLCQAALNVVFAPLAAIIMLTRGVSTGLQAAGIYDTDEAMSLPIGR